MAKKLYEESDIKGIAVAIREKNGESTKYKAREMAAAVRAIPMSGGGNPTAEPNDVNFLDYDGACLYSYTVDEAMALTELPPLPVQEGLICQGWNWTLDEIKAQGRECDVGATYITDDGATRLHINIATDGRMDVPLYFRQSIANGVTIDWGDGSDVETLDGTGYVNTVHRYNKIGSYVISLLPSDPCELSLGSGTNNYNVLGSTKGIVYSYKLYKANIGRNVLDLGYSSFRSSIALEEITMPESVQKFSASFYENGLKSLVIPRNMDVNDGSYRFSLNRNMITISFPYSIKYFSISDLQDCRALRRIVIPDNVSEIRQDAFSRCNSLTKVIFNDKIEKINSKSFYVNASMKYFDFKKCKSVPTLVSANAFESLPPDCEIRVPAALYDEWVAATNWAAYADYIVAV